MSIDMAMCGPEEMPCQKAGSPGDDPAERGETVPSPLVSVVMSVYNRAGFVGEAIESIMGQSFPDFELIVVNDGSTDGSGEIIERYTRADTRLRAFDQPNRGLVCTANRGCALARGKYIARLDSDDVAISNRLERQVEFLERRPEVAVLGGGRYLLGKRGPSHEAGLPAEDDRTIRERLPRCNCLVHSTVMMRTAVFRAVGGYRQAFPPAEDYDLWLRISEHYQLANLPYPLVYYRVHPQQATLTRIEVLAMATLAAQAAARRRVSGGCDPLGDVEQITPEILAALGVTDEMLADGLAQQYIVAAADSLAAGYPQHSRRVLDQAAVSCRSHPPSRAVMGELHWQCAKVHARNREVTPALLCALRACWSKPNLATKPLTYPFRRALSSHTVKKLKGIPATR
jgi:glycosyltransferase involved in cell wall biosynthesis